MAIILGRGGLQSFGSPLDPTRIRLSSSASARRFAEAEARKKAEEEARRRAEAIRRAEEEAKKIAEAKAKRLAEIQARNLQIAREKAQRTLRARLTLQRLRAMTFRQRNEFRTASQVQKLINQGKRPSREGLRIHQKVLANEIRLSKQNQQRQAWNDVVSQLQSIKKPDAKFKVTRKIENFLFDKGILNKTNFRNFENRLLDRAGKFERNKFSKEIKKFGTTGGERLAEIALIPAGILNLVENPSNIKQIPVNIKADVGQTISLLKTSPSEGLARVGADILTFKIVGGTIRITGKVASNVATRLSPRFVGVAKTGSRLKIKGTGKNKVVSLEIVGSIPKESIAKQIRRAGTKVTAVSSQSDNLVKLIRRKKIIRKPIINEEKFPINTKKLLNKFDKGTITKTELIRLDQLIKKAGAKGILERSFFADPTTRVRPSRLGVLGEKEATFKQLLSGQATLKKAKPQILLFEDIQISKFPKSLKPIANKLKKGGVLTEEETKRVLLWQQKQTGKFKPLGFVTREAEITLAPNEVIKRVKKIGVTLVNGKRVPIISTKVIKPTKITQNLIKKARTGKITPKELKSLSKKLKRETGFNYTTSSLKSKKLFFPLKRRAVSSVASRVRRSKPKSIPKSITSKSKIKFTASGSPYILTSSGARFIPLSRVPLSKRIVRPSSTSRPPTSRPPKVPTPPKKPPVMLPKTKKIRKKKGKRREVQVFNVFGKSGKRFVRLNKKPLTKDDALSRGTHAIDNTTSKTFFIKPAGKTKRPASLRRVEQNYFNRQGFKLREFKIKRGRKFALREKFIEKRKHGIDTRGEKRGLGIARYLKQQRSGVKRKVTRKITSIQRKKMLANLSKARRVLKLNRNRRR